MYPVQLRRPRRGADLVLPDVPMLDSPEWSDEEAESKTSNVAPQETNPMAAPFAAATPPMMMNLGATQQNGNMRYSAGPSSRIVMPPPQLPQPVNGVRYPSPAPVQSSPPSLEQQRQQQQRQARAPVKLVVPNDPCGYLARHGGNGGGAGGGRCGRVGTSSRVYNAAPRGGDGLPGSRGNNNRRDRAEQRRGEVAGRRDHLGDAAAESLQIDDEEQDNDGEEDRDEFGLGDDGYGCCGDQHHSPYLAALGSFAAPTLASQAQFGRGSLFVSHQHDRKTDDGKGEEEVNLNSSSGAQHSADGGDDTHDLQGGRGKDVAALLHAPQTGQPSNSNVTMQKQRKPSLLMLPTIRSVPHHDGADGLLAGIGNNHNNNRSDNSTVPSVFHAPLAADTVAEEAEEDDEFLHNRLSRGTSTVFVGPQSVRLERSTGPATYTYGGGAHPQQFQNGVASPQSSDDTTRAHTALISHHGTFLMLAEEANRPASRPKLSPLGRPVIDAPFDAKGANSPLHLLSSSPMHSPLMEAFQKVRSPDREGGAPHRHSPAPAVSPSQGNFFEGNQSTSSNNDYDSLRESKSVVPVPTALKTDPPSDSHADLSGDESEEERYEQMQQSRFFQSLNSRLHTQRTVETDTNRVNNTFASMTWQGASTAHNASEDDVIAFTSGGDSGREGWGAVRGTRGPSTGMTTPSASSSNPDRLNFRHRIVSRQQQPQNNQQVQPLSRFPPTYAAASAMASYATVKSNSSGDNSSKASPSNGSLNFRRGLTSGDANAESSAFSMDANATRNVKVTAAARDAEDNMYETVAQPNFELSTATAAGLGSYERDEYGLLNWVISPTGTRRTSTVSVEDPLETAAASTRVNPFSSASGNRRYVMPISLQPALITIPGRSTGSVTVVSLSEKSVTAAVAAVSFPPYATSSVQQQHQCPFSVENGRAQSSSAVSDTLSSQGMPHALSCAPVVKPSGPAGQWGTDDSAGPQWTASDAFYFQSAAFSPMTGQRGSSPPLTFHLPRSPSFSGCRNSEYFLLNSFRSTSALPQHPSGHSEDAMSPMPAVMESSNHQHHNTNYGVMVRSSAVRNSSFAPSPGIQQTRQNRWGEGGDRKERASRLPGGTPAQVVAIAVVTRSPRLPSEASSGISVDALRSVDDYGFAVDSDNALSSRCYGMDYVADGCSYLPLVSVMASSDAPPRQPHSTGVTRSNDSSTHTSEAPGPTGPATPTAESNAGKSTHRRQRRLSSASVDNSASYYYHQQYSQPPPQRRHSSREVLHTTSSRKDANPSKKKVERGEEPSSKLPRSHASSKPLAMGQGRGKGSPKVPQGPSHAKSGVPPVVPPSSRRVEQQPAFAVLHSSEHRAHTAVSASSKQAQKQNNTQ
ncbi:hypothetical protein ABB37_00057 [Leptomonas pyrrhocoris]|uniref:Uncharacterized protein n=1 Tax=Leptomonas pyrrhocoris TaxID=157538 RepID=A0A0N1J5E5_LEPPY|nr:hypothetical protein ABB37_00057 [Leptomonas pyrrhocoris]KPA85664.1 hypothetical protein ABB37_00057 [Leptomonas pyrrhocoris]|eukprot:XP_015664103.1 hypothetical protein ABB37_00057 [Leptomonas pyrrhocoris]